MDKLIIDRRFSHEVSYSRLLALAALFQRYFSIDWLISLTKRKPSEILIILEKSVREGILKKGEGSFSFVDTKEKQKYQDKLSPDEKQLFHQQIVELILKEPLDDDKKAQVMAPHLLHIPNDLKKCRWLVKAGDIYISAFDNEQALQCYSKAVNTLCSINGAKADSLLSDAAIKYSKICAASHDVVAVLSALRVSAARAKRSKMLDRQALLKMHIAKNEWFRSRYSNAFKHFREGWSIAKGLGDPCIMRAASTFSTFFLYWQGQYIEAIRSYEQFLSDGKYAQHDFPLFGTLMVGHCHAMTGQITQGLSMLHSILSVCQQRGDKYLASQALHSIGAIMLDIGCFEEAVQYLNYSIEEGRKGQNKWIEILGKLLLAFAYYLKGDTFRGVESLREYLESSKRVQAVVVHYPYLMEMCWLMEQGKFPRVPGISFEKEMDRMIRDKNIFMKGVAYRYRALLERKKSLNPQTIIKSLNLSLKWLKESGHQIEIAKSQFELARQYLLLGNETKAKKTTRLASKMLFSLNDALIPDDLRFLTKDQLLGEGFLNQILELGKELVAIPHKKDLIQSILSTINRILGAEQAGLFLFEESTVPPKIHLKASTNLTPEMITQPIFKSSMKMIREVGLTRQGRITKMSPSDTANCVRQETIRSSICVPIIRGNKVVGVLYHVNQMLPVTFRESDLNVLSFFAALVLFALDYGQVSDEVQRLNEKLQEMSKPLEEISLESARSTAIVGHSYAIKDVIKLANQVAKTESNVLIAGETGVGKELLAKAIHDISLRRDRPFIHLQCSALPETLITSELFGHEKGAFTGATHRRLGRVELADNGTLFLDEVGDLPLNVQVRLLRVLQSKEFERIGGNETLRSDFRLIAASHRDLQMEVAANRFRADLYYRLNVFPICIPPLRERKEDIPLLAHHFLQTHRDKVGKSFKMISKEGINRLLHYDWPGNVRELENVIERRMILESGPILQIPHIGGDTAVSLDLKPHPTLKENERHHILSTLEKTGWKVRGPRGAAELLDIHPSTLEFRIKKLDIQRPSKVRITKKNSIPISSGS